jgi:hypothetical protein
MKARVLVCTVAWLAVTWGALCAQTAVPAQAAKPPLSDEAYEKTMKEIASTWRSLQFNNKAMNHADGEREAKRLAAWFRDVQAYWEAKKAADAVAFAKTAVTAAQDIARSSMAMDMTVLAAAETSLAGACQGCHMAHRQQLPDGTYRIK